MLLALSAIAIQCFLVQTHVHAGPERLSANAPIVEIGVRYAGAMFDHPEELIHHGPIPPNHGQSSACYLCQSALGGAAVLSYPPTVALIANNVIANATAIDRRAPVRALRSHAWQSRAPPPLQL